MLTLRMCPQIQRHGILHNISMQNNKYNNYNYTLDKDSLWNSNSNKTFIKLIKSIRDRRHNYSTTLSNCVSI